MRILVLLTDAFGGTGGIAKFNRDFLTTLCSHPKCEEVVAIPRLMPNPPEPLPSKLTYVTEGLNSKPKFTWTVLKTVWCQPKFDLILCGHLHLLFLATIAKKILRRKPLALIIHGVEAWTPTKNPLVNYAASRINHLISVSKFSEDKFIHWANPQNCEKFILPNGVDLNQFTPGEKRKDLLRHSGLEGKKVIMTLARLEAKERYKGIDEVLEVMPELLKGIPNLAYLIVGDGTDRKRLEIKSKALHLNGHVVFAGHIPESEKADHYRLADAFVMPGWGEGFGIVYLEALACGIPVIGSKLDASREALIGGELGILVDPRNPEEIQSAIKIALRERDALPKKVDFFSIENFRIRLGRILDDIAAKGTPKTRVT